ncbi:MAG: dihydrofolate reductase family protein [Gemmatimonadaceae bacterium]|nr:dihydrofolate reductase family protein [Acetobacteraceae bacterium]
MMAHEPVWLDLLALAHGSPMPAIAPDAMADDVFRRLYRPIASAASIVVGQLGQSLDGRIATETGHSHYLNGTEGLLHLHRLRALVDAVVVGIGTVQADNPRLTVRRVRGPNPVRVVIDPDGRMDSAANLATDGAAPTLVIHAPTSRPPPGIEGVALTRSGRGFAPQDIVAALAERGLRRLLIEGGARTVSAFLAAGALHRLHVCVAPLLIGSGLPGLTLPPVATLDDALRPPAEIYQLGADVLFDLDLKPA